MPPSSLKILSGLADGQVLQRLGARGASLTLQGEGPQDGPLLATITKGAAPLPGWKAKPVGRVTRGKFKIKLSGLPTGGPYRLRLASAAARTEIPSFFVGDVWILAGQSNMEGVGDMTGRARSHPLIRAFSMRREWRLAEDPLHILAESPDTCHAPDQCTPEAGEETRKKAGKGVGAGVFFARDMLERTGAPQGLIATAHGGTSMAQWDPAQKHLGGQSLYASMLASVQATGQPVSGLLWYQGESDASPDALALYTGRMKDLVAASRRDLGLPRLPWIIVQIARVFCLWPNSRGWNGIQEEQRLLPERLKYFETVSAIDLPLDDAIHIGSTGFPRLAARLASAAHRLASGNKDEAPMPRLRRMRVIETPAPIIELSFDSVRGGLKAEGEPTGFKFISPVGAPLDLIYKVELVGDIARLHIGDRPPPGSVLHYGYGTAPVCNITDARGFALPVFGPLALDKTNPEAALPFITQWDVSEIVVTAGKRLDRLSSAKIDAIQKKVKNYSPDGFINEHPSWEARSGLAFFQSRLHLGEPMKLDFLMGYDGPFRLWLDGKPFFTDLQGANPCLPDKAKKTAALSVGTHVIQVGMDLNDGRAWGFQLRFARRDVSRDQLWIGEFLKPVYSI